MLLWGPLFVAASVRPNMLNMPKSAYGVTGTAWDQVVGCRIMCVRTRDYMMHALRLIPQTCKRFRQFSLQSVTVVASELRPHSGLQCVYVCYYAPTTEGVAGIMRCCDPFVCPSVCLSVCLSRAARSRTVRFRLIVTIEY